MKRKLKKISPYFRRGGGGWPAEQAIGEYQIDPYNTSNWTKYGAINSQVTFGASSITVGAGTSSVNDYMVLNQYTGMENIKVSFTATMTNTSYFIYGLISRSVGASPRGYCHEITKTGHQACYFLGGTPGGALAFTTKGATPTEAYSAGDVLRVYIEKNNEFVIISQQVNNDPVFTQSFDTTFFDISTNNQANICSPFFMNVDCDMVISDFKVSTTKNKNIPVLFVGDSITQGAYAESYDGIFGKILTADINAGGAEFSQDTINKLDEILLINPQRVFLLTALNDEANSVPDATWQANISTITTTLEAAGITVIHLLYAGFGAFGTTVNSYITTTYPSAYIDTATPLETSPGVINPIYDSGDDHPNAAGHALIASTISGSPLY